MPDKPAPTKARAKAVKPKPAPQKDVVAKLIDLRPEIEAALASGSYPDFILSGLPRASRGIRGLTNSVKQDAEVNRREG